MAGGELFAYLCPSRYQPPPPFSAEVHSSDRLQPRLVTLGFVVIVAVDQEPRERGKGSLGESTSVATACGQE